MTPNESGMTKPLVGAFVLGGLLGAALAILFAPASGRETRERLSRAAHDATERVRELARRREREQEQAHTM